MGYLLFLLATDQVLEEVDGEVVAVAEVRLHVDGEERVHFALALELGAERGRDYLASRSDIGLHA